MLFRTRFYRALAAGLACAALLTGCAAGQGRRAHRPRVNLWPDAWPRPFLDRSQPQPEYQPIPADPSGSPYQPSSPRNLYVPSGPAPDSKLGLPVPPPLPPGGGDAGPVPDDQSEVLPQPIPPAAEDMDVSLDVRSTRRPGVIAPPPPPEPLPQDFPRVAERTNDYDRRRQPVDLQVPEADFESELDAEFPLDNVPPTPNLGRSPVEAFPQPRQTNGGLQRGPSHTPPIEDGDEPLPSGVDPSSHRPQSGVPGPLPILRDPDEGGLTFPGVNQQMSGVGRAGVAKVDAAVSRISVRGFRLTRDARSDGDAAVVDARSLRRGQHLVVQTELDGLEKIQRNGDSITRITCHIEIRNVQNKVCFRGDKQSSSEVNPARPDSRHLNQWVTIPARLNPGTYTLQLHVQDDIARQTTVVEMPVEVQ